MKASDLLVKALENEGVKYIFGIPGEENLDFINSLKDSSIKLILTRHEQAAGFMAATYGRLTGKAGVCLSTLGPGATNLTTAAAYAQLGGMPMLMITAQKPLKNNNQGGFQMVDVVAMMKPLTKSSKKITSGDDVANLVREAFANAEQERFGAVHLELPEDIAAEETNKEVVHAGRAESTKASDKDIKNAADIIKKAERPLLLIGAGANRHATCATLQDFVEKTGMFFFTTQMGKGVIDERHPKFLQTAALSAYDFVHCAVDRADVIISVGHDPVEKPPFLIRENGSKVVHVNNYSSKSAGVYEPYFELLGKTCDSMERLGEALTGGNEWDFVYFEKLKKEIDNKLSKEFEDSGFPAIPQRIVADVRKAMPDDGIVTLDNGMYKIWFARHYMTYNPNTLLLDNALATMGAGLPSAIAAKLIYPDKKVMAICGDGGFMMNSQEMETAVRLGLDLVVVVLRDNAYGMIKWKQNDMEFDDFGLDFGNPDFVKYAESYGAAGWRVEKVEDLENRMRECLNASGVHLVEVPVDYSENKIFAANKKDARICILE